MEGCGGGAMTQRGGPREPQPSVTDAPQDAALGQPMIAFRIKGPSIAGADGAQLSESGGSRKGARANAAPNVWLIGTGLRIR
jgi:hypothetical protein